MDFFNSLIDPAGGINTCIADDGTVLRRDKLLWSQWRAVWVCSALHRRFSSEGDWLPIAKHIRVGPSKAV